MKRIVVFALVLNAAPLFGQSTVYEETNVKGMISGIVQQGSLIKMQSGSIYEVTFPTIQVVVEVAPEALVLRDGLSFKLTIDGFDEQLICRQLVPPAGRRVRPQPPQVRSASYRTALSKTTPLERLMPLAQQRLIGIQKLTPIERERLRVYLITLYSQGIQAGKESKSISLQPRSAAVTASVIESKIDGAFEGWDGDTIVKLLNGQIWKQADFQFSYSYKYMPKVLIYRSGAGYKMKIDGNGKTVRVTRLK